MQKLHSKLGTKCILSILRETYCGGGIPFAHLRICTPLNRDLAIRHIFLKLFSSEGILEFSIKFPSTDIHNILDIDIDNICAYFFCYFQNAFHWSSAVPKRFKRNINEELHQAM